MEVEWEGQTTEPIPVSNRSVAGCPISPLVFMLCATPMEQALEGSGRGVSISYSIHRGEI